jgi:hypothetical protein
MAGLVVFRRRPGRVGLGQGWAETDQPLPLLLQKEKKGLARRDLGEKRKSF